MSTLDRIEKVIELKAPVGRVWRALTDHEEFGTWFRVRIDAPFEPGRVSTGHMTFPGYEHLRWHATIVKMEPNRIFAFTWHPYAMDPVETYARETPTLVEFTLQPIANGTRLQVVESGFDKLPPHRRDEAFRMNDRGWSAQIDNIARHLLDAA